MFSEKSSKMAGGFSQFQKSSNFDLEIVGFPAFKRVFLGQLNETQFNDKNIVAKALKESKSKSEYLV